METVLYIDVLFLGEWIMDATILILTGYLLRKKCGNLKCIAVGALESFFHCIYMFHFQTVSANYVLTFGVWVMGVWYLFRPKSMKDILYLFVAIFVASFALGGCIQFFLTFCTMPISLGSGMSIKADWMPWQLLIWSVLMSYMFVHLAKKWMGIYVNNRKEFAEVSIYHRDKTTSFVALMDTGNTLSKDGLGVIIVEAPRLFSILDISQIQSYLTTTEKEGFEPILYNSLGNENGVLWGFYVERCVITTDLKKIDLRNIYIGIGDEKFTGGWEALIPSCFLEEEGL